MPHPSPLRPRPGLLPALLPLLAAAAACAPTPATDPAGPAEAAYVYACPDGTRFGARFRADSVVVTLPLRTVRLPQVRAASGIRYREGDVEFRGRGTEAALTVGPTRREGCRGVEAATPWEEARLRGVEFRAVGQEPGWILELDQGRALRYLGDYGSTQAAAPAPEPERDASGTAVYRAGTDAGELVAAIREAPCEDAMSGEAFSHQVTVRLGAEEVRGCGRTLPTGEADGVAWTLLELGGTPAVPASGRGEPFLRLAGEGEQLTGSTGCNTLGGRFQREGERIRIGPVATTRAACLDPAAARQEQALLEALGAADGLVVRGDTLELLGGGRTLARFLAAYLR